MTWIATPRGNTLADGTSLWAVMDGHEIDGEIIAEDLTEKAAKLMAAAPDLLTSLQSLLAEFDRYDAAMTKIGRGHEDYGGQREAARAVIARAKGGA